VLGAEQLFVVAAAILPRSCRDPAAILPRSCRDPAGVTDPFASLTRSTANINYIGSNS